MSYNDTATAQIDIESLDLSTDDTIPVERTFLGMVTQDQKEPGKFGPQWHFAVKPLSFTLNSQTGSFHVWPAIKFSKKDGSLITQGEYGRTVEAVRKVFGKSNIGVGELVGRIGHFALRKLEYGKDKRELLDDGTPNPNLGLPIMGGKDSLIAIRAATPEEVAGAGVPSTQQTSAGYSPEDVAAMLSVMAGKTVLEYNRGLGRRTDLSPAVKNAITDGTAANALVAMGAAELVNGVLQPVAAAV